MIKVAVIGAGNISRNHVGGYIELSNDCKITAIVDIYREKAEKLAKDYGLTDVAIYEKYEDMLSDSAIDLVSVCTPPYLHAQISIACMEAGMHVLCEKPMASSVEECDKMIDASRQTERMLSIVSQNRFLDPIMKLKKTLDSGMLGKLLWAEVDSYWWRGHCYYDLWWRGTWEKEGGGCVLNHAVHHIDMLSWMMGSSPKQVVSSIYNLAHDNSEVEDAAVAMLTYDNGAVARLTSSVIHHGEKQKLEFHGEHAKISAPWDVYASVSQENGFPKRNEELEAQLQSYYENLPALKYTGHTGQIENVLQAIKGEGTLLVRGEDGRRSIELITAVYKSGFEKKPAALPISVSDPWYTVEGVRSRVIPFHKKSGSIENFNSSEITMGSAYVPIQ